MPRWITARELLDQGVAPFEVVQFIESGGVAYNADTGVAFDPLDRLPWMSRLFGTKHTKFFLAAGPAVFADPSSKGYAPDEPARPEGLLFEPEDVAHLLAKTPSPSPQEEDTEAPQGIDPAAIRAFLGEHQELSDVHRRDVESVALRVEGLGWTKIYAKFKPQGTKNADSQRRAAKGWVASGKRILDSHGILPA